MYGPGASLFTLGPNNTVQQFDLNAPAVKVADVQHPANLLPPSPPVSIEEQERKAAEEAAEAAEVAAAAGAMSETESAITSSSAAATSESEISIRLDGGVSESDDDHLSPFARMQNAAHIDALADSESDLPRTISPAPSQNSELSSRSGHSSQTPHNYPRSLQSRALTEHTYMSIGSSLKSSALSNINQQYQPQHSSRHPSHRRHHSNMHSAASGVSGAITSTTFSTNTSGRTGASRPSRLRNEVPRSPDDAKVHDLFKFTRSRLTDVPYRMPPPLNNIVRLTNDDLRRQMLQTVFGWTEDIEDLIRDEMSRSPAGSANRILLAKWLGDIDPDIIAASSETMTSSDWMLLALSGIGSQASQHKLGRAYIQRLLESGDLNAAATIMIGMGDHNDAIEIYASHHKYMEALLVASLFYPSVWERQSHLIKKWGEWAIKNGHRELAIRCAACTGKESTEPWTSPSAAQINFPSIHSTVPELLSPPLSPPSVMQRGPQRSVAKSSALRLITNFGDDSHRAKFYSNQDGDGATPIAAGVTPIVDTAISPGLGGTGDMTAFIRPSQRSTFNTPSSARPSGGFGRQRLPSIGEAPNDANHPRNLLKGVSAALNDPPTQPKEAPRSSSRNEYTFVARAVSPPIQGTVSDNNFSIGMALQRASTSSPLYSRKDQPMPSPSPASLAMLMDGRHSRNGPRNRIPLGLDLSIGSVGQGSNVEATSPERSGTSTNRYRWPTRRRGPGSVSSSVTSNSSLYGSRSSRFRTGDIPTTGKTLDEYINSIDAAKTRDRASSRERRHKSRESSRNRRPSAGSATPSASSVITVGTYPLREQQADDNWSSSRGYSTTKSSGKRSPRSPVPMSPEDLINLSTPRMFGRDDIIVNPSTEIAPLTVRKASSSSQQQVDAARPSSKSRPTSRASSRGRVGRGKSPDRRPPALEIPRGRNASRTASTVRSPSSPLPFTNSEARGTESVEDEEDLKKAIEDKERFRNRDRTSTNHGRASSKTRRASSPGSAKGRDRSQSRRRTPLNADPIDRAATASTSRNHRATGGPPPAPSALAVASGVGLPVDRDSSKLHPQQAVGEELGRRRTQSAMSDRSNRGDRGDLRQLSKDERAERKAAAARELENRRKSLVRHPMAPSIVHPDYLSPGLPPQLPQMYEVSSPPTDLPTRSQTAEPGSMSKASSSSRTRSMFAPRGTTIGLPATPKAMRLVMEPGAGAGNSTPEMPPIPSGYSYYSQQQPQQPQQLQQQQQHHQNQQAGSSSGNSSPQAGGSPHNSSYGFQPAPAPAAEPKPAKEETLTLLPSTVYQPPAPSRGAIPRSMSAPPQELVYHKGSLSQDFASPRKTGRSSSKASIPEEGMGSFNQNASINSLLGGTLTAKTYRRPSLDNLIPPPPPPPPAPPMLKELAHLAMPPPPPPAPLPFGSMGGHNAPVVYGGHTSGTIEVVMDDDEVQPIVAMGQPSSNQYSAVPPPPPPPPLSMGMETLSPSRNGHQRGRSSTDNSIAGRISRATERMRSASRGANNASAASRARSPEMVMAPYESIHVPQSRAPEMTFAPYESVPAPMSFSARNSPPQQHQAQQQAYQQQMRTGLHHSEMI